MDVDVEPEKLVQWLHTMRGRRSLTEVAAELGVSTSALHRYESGERSPPFHSVVMWAEKFPSFPGKVTYGKTGKSTGNIVEQTIPPYGAARDSEYVELPLFDIAASAGAGKWNESERVKTYLQFRRDWLMWTCGTTAGLSLITADGDSMIKSVPSGSVVLVRELPSWNLGEGIYFMRLNGRDVIKRVTPVAFEPREHGALAFRATVSSDTNEQEKYPPRDVLFTQEERHENDIYARAVWVGYKLP